MKRALAAGGVALLVGLAGWQGASALQSGNSATPAADQPVAPEAQPTPAEVTEVGEDAPAARAAPGRSAQPELSRGTTPMNQRVAVIGLLNKRNGLWRDLTMKPGQAIRVGDAIVRLRACETTAPWEQQKLTGAFVQLDVEGSDSKWRRVFSGWLYKESPSLNVVEHQIYDVWPKSCAMTHPDIGPGTVSVGSLSSGGAKRESSAPKSTEGAPAAKPSPTPSASSSKAT